MSYQFREEVDCSDLKAYGIAVDLQSRTMWWMLLLLCTVQYALCFQPRIIGGQDAYIADYPYQVSIHDQQKLLCGGSIISQNWVLTAAHCVSSLGAWELKIRLGSTFYNKGGTEIRQGLQVIRHPKYNSKTLDYDVALIKLPQKIPTSQTIKPVTLASYSSSVNAREKVVVTGWGYVTENGPMSTSLKKLTLPVVDQKECKQIYSNANITITDNMICTSSLNAEDACKGDSGGPLVYNKVQIGIVSWSLGKCTDPRFPGVYTRVSAVRQWIKENTQV